MTGVPGPGSPLATLRRITAGRPPVAPGERCEMCAEPIADLHQHVVDLTSRSLMCTCRGCYLLFSDKQAHLRFRAVPDRYLSFPDFEFTDADWDSLQIPVGLVFCFDHSDLGHMVSFYPGPAGATESELPTTAWDDVIARNPGLAQLQPDVEALLIRRAQDATFSAHLVPIDACYELVGTMRMTWRGFDGGQEAQRSLEEFFAQVARRSRPATSVGTA